MKREQVGSLFGAPRIISFFPLHPQLSPKRLRGSCVQFLGDSLYGHRCALSQRFGQTQFCGIPFLESLKCLQANSQIFQFTPNESPRISRIEEIEAREKNLPCEPVTYFYWLTTGSVVI